MFSLVLRVRGYVQVRMCSLSIYENVFSLHMCSLYICVLSSAEGPRVCAGENVFSLYMRMCSLYICVLSIYVFSLVLRARGYVQCDPIHGTPATQFVKLLVPTSPPAPDSPAASRSSSSTCVFVCVCICVCVYVCVCLYVCMYIHVYTYECMYIYIYIYCVLISPPHTSV